MKLNFKKKINKHLEQSIVETMIEIVNWKPELSIALTVLFGLFIASVV